MALQVNFFGNATENIISYVFIVNFILHTWPELGIFAILSAKHFNSCGMCKIDYEIASKLFNNYNVIC